MRRLTLKHTLAGVVIGVLTLGWTSIATAHAPSGAIFTTLPDGSEVNYNHYAAKEDVYLDGGPGPGAPQTAAGLDDGTYVFQVTDPSGKVLLSSDPAGCRIFRVLDGIIIGVGDPAIPTTCAQATGDDVDHGATTVQLMPYDDTPNNGGVYKVWVTTLGDYLLGCANLGITDPVVALATVDPGFQHGPDGAKHGFIPGHSKTDNFKVGKRPVIEIDTRFWDWRARKILDGLGVTWIDTLGASNKKYSYYSEMLDVNHEAHVEAVEPGVHTIVIEDGPGYKINDIHLPDGSVINGPGAVTVRISNLKKDLTVFIDVDIDWTQ